MYSQQVPSKRLRLIQIDEAVEQIPRQVYLFNFFIVKDGVISFSLRDLTISSTVIISTSFLAMLYVSCVEEMVECNI